MAEEEEAFFKYNKKYGNVTLFFYMYTKYEGTTHHVVARQPGYPDTTLELQSLIGLNFDNPENPALGYKNLWKIVEFPPNETILLTQLQEVENGHGGRDMVEYPRNFNIIDLVKDRTKIVTTEQLIAKQNPKYSNVDATMRGGYRSRRTAKSKRSRRTAKSRRSHRRH